MYKDRNLKSLIRFILDEKIISEYLIFIFSKHTKVDIEQNNSQVTICLELITTDGPAEGEVS